MFAGFFEEICQIHFPSAVGIFGKPDRFYENFIIAGGVEESRVHAAKVDKVESGATHDEHGFKLILIGYVGKMADPSAVLVHGELANAFQFALHQSLVGQCLPTVGNAATSAKLLLLLLILNG